jgi:hypothetical protein
MGQLAGAGTRDVGGQVGVARASPPIDDRLQVLARSLGLLELQTGGDDGLLHARARLDVRIDRQRRGRLEGQSEQLGPERRDG